MSEKKAFFTVMLVLVALLFLEAAPELKSSGKKDERISVLTAQLEKARPAKKLELLHKIAEFYMDTDPQKLINFSLRALKLSRSTSQPKDIARSEKNIGIGYIYLGDYKKAETHTLSALRTCKKYNLTNTLPVCHNNLGVIYRYQAQYAKSLHYFQKALPAFQRAKNQRIAAITLDNIGIIHYFTGNYEKALKYYNQALELRKKLNHRQGQGDSLNQIAVIYGEMGKQELALDFYRRSIDIFTELDNPRGLVNPLNNIGTIYYEHFKDYKKAREYFKRTLTIRRRLADHFGESVTLNNLGNVCLSEGRLDRALQYYQKALKLKQSMGNRREITDSLRDIGEVYRLRKDYARAITYTGRALKIAREIGARQEMKKARFDLAKIYKDSGDFRAALENYEKFAEIDLELRNLKVEKITAEAQARFETREKEEQISHLKKQAGYQKRIRNLLFLSVILVLLMLILLFNRLRQRKRSHEEQLRLNREISIQKEKLTELNRILEKKSREYYLNSIMDSLTGIYNRAFLEDSMSREFSRSVRHKRNLAFILLDIDHFKEINDSFGHQAGDDVLKKLAQLMSSLIRKEDILGRYGGEEFLFILPDTDRDSAYSVAENMRKKISAADFTCRATPIRLSVSLGISDIQTHPHCTVHEIVHLADQALYEAKARGRNQTVLKR